ncbi:E3 SUMO-protein ligase ZBED1 isoform X3 [Amia ocellicauda]|uniref:E3 SUMO-protein ligase ZBED1 isoform X3 n=1 Tax=Amia ocellicauda TaxID=2972642 RepID=UPI003464A379
MESSEMNSNHKTAEWDFRKSILAPDHIKQETSEEDLENSEKNAHTQRGDRAQQCSNAAACEARLGSDQIKVEIVEWESFTIVQVGMDESAESLPGEPEGFAIELCKSEPEEPKPDVEGIEELESADVKQESCGLLHNGEEAEMHSDAFAPYSPQVSVKTEVSALHTTTCYSSTMNNVQSSKKTCNGDIVFSCCQCNRAFICAKDLTKHQECHAVTQTPYDCTQNGRTFSKEGESQHIHAGGRDPSRIAEGDIHLKQSVVQYKCKRETKQMSRKRSAVWDFFAKCTEDPKKAECKLCKRKLVYHGGTTNLRDHLTSIHPLQFKHADSPSTSISEKRERDITDDILAFIALDMRPITVIEGEGFQKLMKTLEPLYTIPTRETILTEISHKYAMVKTRVFNLIKQCTAVSFTTDIWTSFRMEAYMTVSCHLITEDWRLENYVLETKELAETAIYTAANISERLSQVVDAYEIPPRKRLAVVHDNTANMVLCIERLQIEEPWEKMYSVRCAGHVLQHCVNLALQVEPVSRTIAAARRLVGHFQRSATAAAALKVKQQEQKVIEHQLTQDEPTIWHSTFFMLQCLVEQRWPVTAVLSDPNVTRKADQRNFDLTSTQWIVVEDTAQILKPLVTLTELLTQEENLSLSATLPMLSNMKNRHLAPQDEDSPAVTALKRKLIEQIDNRWQLTSLTRNNMYVLASALDPRFKHLKFISQAAREAAYTEIESQAGRLSKPQVSGQTELTPQTVPFTSVEDESLDQSWHSNEENVSKKRKTEKEKQIAMLLHDVDEEDGNERHELEEYLKDKSKVAAGVLKWWKNNEDRYPKLARLAKEILCIPATSTPAERIFSKAGYIINKTRCSLLPQNVDKLIFLSHNMKQKR